MGIHLHFSPLFSKEPMGLEFAPLLQAYKDKPEKLGIAAMSWSILKLKEISPTIYHDDNGHILEWGNPIDKQKIMLQMANTAAFTEERSERIKNGICAKCQKPISGILKKSNSTMKVKLGAYMYLQIYTHSGLCIECIEEFLRDMMSQLQHKAIKDV